MGESKQAVLKFIDDRNLSFPVLLDMDKEVSARYGVRSHPMKFLINKNGELIGISRGYMEWDAEEMKDLIKALIRS